MTSFDLRKLHLRPGEEQHEALEVDLDPLTYGGQRYQPEPPAVEADLSIARTVGGQTFRLRFQSRFVGPCYRCLGDAEVGPAIEATEYQADEPGADEELRTPYLTENTLELTAWARDTIALALPEKVLCRPDCAGLCAVCGKDLNVEPHEHEPEPGESRWSALAELKSRLEDVGS